MRESSGEPSVIHICDSDSPERVVIIGFVILVAAVFGYHVTGSTGTHVNGSSPVGRR
jgi:hypothetical protein